MIHLASSAPVLVRKIDLRVWSLRDEVESILRKRLGEDPRPDVRAVMDEYGDPGRGGAGRPKDGGGPVVLRQVRPPLPPGRVHHGSVFISELQMDRIRFFSSAHFLEGQAVAMEFIVPERFIVNADVLHCHRYSMRSRVISPTTLSFRAVAEFSFLKRGERTLLRKLVRSIASIGGDAAPEDAAPEDAAPAATPGDAAPGPLREAS